MSNRRTAPAGTRPGSATRPGARTSTITRSTGSTDTVGAQRARIVGTRTGLLADAVVQLVRIGRSVGAGVATVARRAGAVVTPFGWVVLAVIPLAFVAGYRLGWLEFVAVGWAAVVLVAAAALYLLGGSRLEVRLGLTHRRVVAGDTATGVLEVDNPARRRAAAAVIEVPVASALARVPAPRLRREETFRHEFPIPARRRGIVPVGPARMVRADPLGLVRRELVWDERLELVVHPRTIPVPSTSTGLIRDLEGAPTRDLTPSDVAFHALREYQPGDERRYIHWKSSAKTGTYMVRQFEQTRRSHLVVALSVAAADYRGQDEFELAVSVAGSLGVRAIRDGRTVSVVVSGITPEFAKRAVASARPLATHVPVKLLDELAVVEPVASAVRIRELARLGADQSAGISVAFLICGSPPTSAQLRAAAVAFPADVEVVAMVCDPDAVPGARRVAGFTVLTIGYLEDLRAALGRRSPAA